MAALTRLDVNGFRSIGDEISIRFPAGKPIVIVGENNAGKSNIIRALDHVLGDRWPGSWAPEDHDYHLRNTDSSIRITCGVTEVSHRGSPVDCFELTSEGGTTEINVELTTGNRQWPNNETRGKLPCVVISADRRLSYQLSYASQWTMLSKLMHRFHKVLVADPDRRERLKEHFDGLHELFGAVPEYAAFAKRLKSEVEQLGANMPYGLEVDFSAYDPSNFFRSLRVHPQLDGEIRTFDELGTGQEQILALGFAYAYAAAFSGSGDGLILVIEEPEAHLHPLAQEWLASQLHRFTGDGVQVVITTHSPSFIDIRNLDALVLVSKSGGVTETAQRTAQQLADYCVSTGADKATADSILEHYDINATPELRAGFFARAIVLVEGRTESFALPSLLRTLGVDMNRLGIACIPVGGKGNLAKWWRLFTAFGIPTLVVFDNDVSDDGKATKRCDVLSAVGIDEAEQSDFLDADSLVLGEAVAVMGTDFEHTLRGLIPTYETLEMECRDQHGALSKPFIARWCAERLKENECEPLRSLADKIARLVEAEPPAAAPQQIVRSRTRPGPR